MAKIRKTDFDRADKAAGYTSSNPRPDGYTWHHHQDVDYCFDNHMAVRVWVQRRLDAQGSYILEEMCGQLQGELYEMFSSFSYGL